MKRADKLLLLIIAVEAIQLVALGVWRLTARPRPDARVEFHNQATAEDLRRFEALLDPFDGNSWAALGDHYRTFGVYPAAAYCFEQAHQLSPRDGTYLFFWAATLDRMGDTGQANQRYQQALDSGPLVSEGVDIRPFCWLFMGRNLLREEKPVQAEKQLRKVLHLPEARLLLSRLLIRGGRANQAVSLLDELLKEHPNSLWANQMRSFAEQELGRPAAARTYQGRSLRGTADLWIGDPLAEPDRQRQNNVGGSQFFYRGLRLGEQGKLPEAAAQLRQSLDLAWHKRTALALARIELKRRRPQSARDLINRCAQRFGQDRQSLDLLGDVWAQLGDVEQARAYWRRANQFIATERTHEKLAASYRQTKQTALSQRRQGLALYEQGKKAWLRNDLSAAEEKFAAASELIGKSQSNGDAHVWYYLADARRHLNDNAGAQAAFARCLKINPDHGRALRGRRELNAGQD